MRIGIYGDSFAEKNSVLGWWNFLQTNHNHEVTCYGVGGSSILFSTNLLLEHHSEYDINIWCQTCPGRFSICLGTDQWLHSTNYMTSRGHVYRSVQSDYKEIISACEKYIKYLSDPHDENLIGKALAAYVQQLIPNLIVIPCFYPPLSSEFNLFDLCGRELQQIFPDQDVWTIYQTYDDIRQCHLTRENNEILAEMIDNDMTPRIFNARYEDFCFDNIQIAEILKNKS